MLTEIIKLFIVFFLIIVLLNLKIDLWLNLMLNSIFIGFIFNIELKQIAAVLKGVTIDIETIKLVTIIFMVYFLSAILDKLKKYEGMVDSLQKLIFDYRAVMIFLSSFIALLPIQGGAIFSAPMVKSLGERNHATSEENMFVNYWFRHVWEFMWPLYPEIILYASLLKIPIKNLIFILFPFAIIAFIIGAIWVNRNLTTKNSSKKDRKLYFNLALKSFFGNTWPILLTVLLVVLFNIDLLYSLLIVLVLLFFFNKDIRANITTLFLYSLKKSYSTLLLIYSILIFKEILVSSQMIEILPKIFISSGIPNYIALIAIPFLVSFFTGNIFACIGICVPVFFGFLINADGVMNESQIVLLYFAGYLGMMITPVHLCLAVTKDFFNIDLKNFYYTLIFNLSIFTGFSLIYYAIKINF